MTTLKTADVLVIGGGITGVAIAYNLARQGAGKVVVLEQGYLASGSTGRCAAGIRTQFGTEMNCLLSSRSLSIWENIREELDGDYDIELDQCGYIFFATNEKEMEFFKNNVALQNKMGIDSRLLSVDEIKEMVPHINRDILAGGSFCQRDGHCNPFLATQAYADAARRLGVEICTRTAVTGLLVENSRVKGVVTDKGTIAAPVVVAATGGWTREIGAMAGVDIPIIPERHQIVVTEPVERMHGPMIMSISYNSYCKQTPHGSFLVGFGDPHEPQEIDHGTSWQFLQETARKTVQVYPLLRELRVVRQWAGVYEVTPDRQPVLGAIPGLEGLELAAGFSGHGFMLAPEIGVLLAQHILGLELNMPIDLLSIERFEKGELIFEPSVV